MILWSWAKVHYGVPESLPSHHRSLHHCSASTVLTPCEIGGSHRCCRKPTACLWAVRGSPVQGSGKLPLLPIGYYSLYHHSQLQPEGERDQKPHPIGPICFYPPPPVSLKDQRKQRFRAKPLTKLRSVRWDVFWQDRTMNCCAS